MSYLKWLQFLIALGPKLPALLKALQDFVEVLMQTWPQPAGEAGGLAVIEATDEELACEVKVAQLVGGPTAAFDGARLRSVFKFLVDSGMLQILIKLAGG